MRYKANSFSGFTLIEMMIVFAVLIALLTLVAPSYEQITLSNRMVGEVYTLRATLNSARSEALSRRAPVVVCPTSDGEVCLTGTNSWRQGYMSFVDTNNDNAPDSTNPDEERLQFNTPAIAMDIIFDNVNRRVRFDSLGEATGFQGRFEFCDKRGVGSARGLILTPVGALRAATDGDDPPDGIVDDGNGGDNVDCQ